MAEAETKTVIPEYVLKKRKRAEEWDVAKKQALDTKKKKCRENHKLIFRRALQHPKEYEAHDQKPIKEKELIRLKGGFMLALKLSFCSS